MLGESHGLGDSDQVSPTLTILKGAFHMPSTKGKLLGPPAAGNVSVYGLETCFHLQAGQGERTYEYQVPAVCSRDSKHSPHFLANYGGVQWVHMGTMIGTISVSRIRNWPNHGICLVDFVYG